ncbi:MAG: hypothetical protein ACOCV1_00215 [Bacillota bacterium]
MKIKMDKIKKIKLYAHEIRKIKEKIRAMVGNEIYRAKCNTYEGYASNDIEGDYGTWDDWFILIAQFGDSLMEEFVEEK